MKLNVLDNVLHEWNAHYTTWNNCVRCRIGIGARHVFARGTVPCDVLFVGEAPGETEAVVGLPFVGRSGKLLDGWIREAEDATALTEWVNRDDGIHCDPHTRLLFTYAVTNTVLCRPTTPQGGNRPPTGIEMANCYQRLIDFIVKVARPKLVVTLGVIAKNQTPIWTMPILNLAHPSWVLRQGGKGSTADNQQRERLCQFLKQNQSLLKDQPSSRGAYSKG